MLDEYPKFLKSVYRKWKCNKVVHIGDLVDNCALSFHLKSPHQKDPVREYDEALVQVRALTRAFPKVDLLLGNHDVLPFRWAKEVGIPSDMLLDFASIFKLPKGWKVWERYSQLTIDGVIYQHGDRGKGGRMSAMSNAKAEFRSVVQGHYHAQGGAEFYANLETRVFGLQVGCGADWRHHQQDYGKKYTSKPVIGCGVVLNGVTPIFEPMIL